MPEQQSSTADVTAEVSDAAFDKYFESGGEEAVETPQANDDSQTDGDTNQYQEDSVDTKDSKEQKDGKDNIDRNYKAAMHEEREKRKEYQKQLEEQKSKVTKLEQTFQRMIDQAQYQQQMQQQVQQQAQEPSFDEDPLTALRLRQERLDAAVQYQYATEAQRQQIQNQNMQQQNFIEQYRSKAVEFSRDNPDFKEAYDYLDKSRLSDFLEVGFNEQQARQLLIEDEMAVAVKAFQDGVNPAERLYKLAKLRGYKAQAKQDQSKQKIDQLQRGLDASKSLSNTGGKTSNVLSLEAAAAMDDEDFAKVDWNKLMKLG